VGVAGGDDEFVVSVLQVCQLVVMRCMVVVDEVTVPTRSHPALSLLGDSGRGSDRERPPTVGIAVWPIERSKRLRRSESRLCRFCSIFPCTL